MTDYAKLKVDEIRKLIVDDSNGLISEEQVNGIKGKNTLIELHKSLTEDVSSDDTPEQESPTEQPIPDFMSPEWNDYVMSLFLPDELNDGNPNVAGLRRVANLIFDNILFSGPRDVRTSVEKNEPTKATVVYEIQYVQYGVTKACSAVASSWIGNTDDEFVPFSESVAETRAEGRVLRKMLGIKNVCADELTNKNTKEIVNNYIEKQQQTDDSSITHVQKTVITKLCERLGINLVKFINSGAKKYDNIDYIPYDTAARMIQRLNEYQTVGEGSVEIPNDLKEN